MIKVSFIVPAYNVENYITECIDSILNQTEKDIEIIIVDDGSTDSTPIIIDNFAKNDDKIIAVHKNNEGLSSARLSGFEIARGQYVLFVDGDDYIEPQMAEKLLDSAKKNNSDVVLCGYFTNALESQAPHLLSIPNYVITGRENIISNYIEPFIGTKKDGINLPRFLCFKLLKRDLIKNDYFKHENIYFSEDVVFNLLYTDNIKTISVVNEPLYHYRILPTSLSNKYRKNKWQMYLNLINFLNNYLNDRNIEIDEERISDTIVNGIFASIDNAVSSGKYLVYKKEIKTIRYNRLVINQLNKDNSVQQFSVRLSLKLLKSRLYFILFSIRKQRLKILTNNK